MKNMKLSTKLGVGFGLLVLIAVALGSVAVWQMRGVQGDVVRLDEEFVPEVDIASEVERNFLTTMLNLRSYTASEDDKDGYVPMFVPVVGPFMLIGTASPSAMGTFWAVASGLGQTTGLALLIVGLVSYDEVLVRKRAGVTILPVASPNDAGLAATVTL